MSVEVFLSVPHDKKTSPKIASVHFELAALKKNKEKLHASRFSSNVRVLSYLATFVMQKGMQAIYQLMIPLRAC